MQLIKVFDPLLVGKYQCSSLKTDPVFLDVPLVLGFIPFDQRTRNFCSHKISITQSITLVNCMIFIVQIYIIISDRGINHSPKLDHLYYKPTLVTVTGPSEH